MREKRRKGGKGEKSEGRGTRKGGEKREIRERGRWT